MSDTSSVAINEASFEEEVAKSAVPVLVDFWAQWCGPCKTMLPIFEQAATQHQGKVKFVKVDVDADPDLASRFGVRGIPTLILFKEGEPHKTAVGALSSAQLDQFIQDGLQG